jgi:hypothetical protein
MLDKQMLISVPLQMPPQERETGVKEENGQSRKMYGK